MTNRIISDDFFQLSDVAYGTDLDPFDLTGVLGDDVDHFDVEAANEEFYKECSAALEEIRPEWCLYPDGKVIGPVDSEDLSEDEIEELDRLIGKIDICPILDRHPSSN